MNLAAINSQYKTAEFCSSSEDCGLLKQSSKTGVAHWLRSQTPSQSSQVHAEIFTSCIRKGNVPQLSPVLQKSLILQLSP